MNINLIKDILEKVPSIDENVATPFNLFSTAFNKVSQKELLHSNILRILLDPNEKHNHNYLLNSSFLILV